MPRVVYPARIIVDAGFVNWLIDNDKLQFLYLTHIKSSSIDAKKKHNIITEEDIDEVLKIGKIKEDTLRGAFRGTIIPASISSAVSEKIDQRIVFAIEIATERPFKTYIFTTKQDEPKYRNSSHYQGVKTISVKSEMDALSIIEKFWQQFKSEREVNR